MPKNDTGNDLLNAEMAADYLDISKVTFYKRKYKLKIKPAFHIGKRGFYKKSDIEILRDKK